MKDGINDLLNDFFGGSGKADAFDAKAMKSTAEQMQAQLEALQKANGTNKSSAAPQTASPAAQAESALNALDSHVADLTAKNRATLAQITKLTSEMQGEMQKDGLITPAAGLAAATETAENDTARRAGFDGLDAALAEVLIGQEAFLQQLTIAFKRPFVMGTTAPNAKNSILICGKKASGKHTAVAAITQELAARRVLCSASVQQMDLSLYPTAQQEKLFLQDLYMALASDGEVLVFNHYEKCHPGFLNAITRLMMKNTYPLNTRYVLQKGRLIDAGTALVNDAVSALTPMGKYLILITENSKAKVADAFGAPLINALGDVCETAALTEDAISQIALREQSRLLARAKQHLQFSLQFAPSVRTFFASGCTAEENVQGIQRFTDKVYAALAQYKLQQNCPAGMAVKLEHSGTLTAQFGTAEAVPLFSLLPQSYQGELEAVKAEMADVVGLTEIKEYILSLEDNFKVQAMRKEQGMKTASVSMHMIFTGNPGTGKTTIARLVSRYLKAIGVLSGGQLVEVTRADLVGKYVGHTAPLTTQVLQSAIGGVLFIDEAYSLYRGKDDSFGLECIDTLVKGIEDNRDNLIVILAGYSREMAEFLTSNSGLKSRFPNIIDFPDYTGEELFKISRIIAKSKGYDYDAGADSPLLAYFTAVQATGARESGNGRLARNKVEEAILNQSKRVVKTPQAALNLLLAEDFALENTIAADKATQNAAAEEAVKNIQKEGNL